MDVNVERQIVELSDDLGRPDETRAVVLRGSYVTGMMSPTSDIDMYVITDGGECKAEHIYRDDIDFHVRHLPLQYLRYQIADLNLRYLGFFLHARVIVDKDGTYERLANEVASIPDDHIYRTWHDEVRHQLSDAEGQMALGNVATARYLARFGSHLLAQVCLLRTSTPTYKHKDVVSLLVKSTELGEVRNQLLATMELDAVDPGETRSLLDRLREVIEETTPQVAAGM